MKGRAGYIFPMILFASLAVGLLVLTLTQFQSSNRQKYQHLNDYQAAFNIAYSALVEVLADIQSRQWSNRSFKSGPKDRSANLFGGSYNLRVEDHTSIEFMFNVKVRVKFKEKSHLFYWRMQYNPSLLDFTNLFIPVYYEEYGDPANAPSDIDSKVDEIMQRRNDNLPKVEEIADRLRPTDSIKEALEVVGIDPGGVNQADLPRPGIETITMPPINLPLKPVSGLVSAVDPAANHVIKAFQFGIEVSALTEAQKEHLNALAEILRERTDTRIVLRGHTDAVGASDYNMQLSIERAQSVADYLSGEGISSSRMTVRGYGETQPIASNDTDAGKAKNRRVEFVLKEDP